MNKVIPVVVTLVSSIFADTLYLKNGQEIKDAVVTEIDDMNVKYKIGKKQVIYTAKKSDIAIILYDDGTKDIFNSEQEERQAAEMPKLEKSTEKELQLKDTYEGSGEEKSKRHGIRIAFNNSAIFDEGFDMDAGVGTGFAVGWITSIPIANTITFNPELNFIYRKPAYIEYTVYNGWYSTTVDVDVTEFAISVPALFQGMPFGGPIFYLEGGVQLDIPFMTEINASSGDVSVSEDYPGRAYVDFGIAVGFGWHIGEHYALGIRWVIGLTDFDDGDGSLIQAGLGLSYLF